MVFKYFDRVKETSTTTGTGNITLGGAVSQFQAFSSRYSDTDNMYYLIADQNGTAWEVGVGTYNSSGNTLSRTTVLESSNSDSAVNFTSGSLYVSVVFAASSFVSSTIASGSAINLSNNTTANITSISLPAGDWEVSGNVVFTANAATTATVFQAAISSTSATLPTAPGAGALSVLGVSVGAGGTEPTLPTGVTRIVLTTTTTIYLVAQSTFAVNTMSAYGYIQAWRR